MSYSAVKLLNESPWHWHRRYILGIREDEYKDYFSVWWAFHYVIELYNKDWVIDREAGYEYIRKMAKEANITNIDNEIKTLDCLLDNYFASNPERAMYAEMKIEFEWYWYNFVAVLDAVTNDTVMDYKTVSSFTNLESDYGKDKLAEYHFQAGFYMIAYKRHHWEYPKSVTLLEVKKSTPNLMYTKKEDICKMAWISPDTKLTKDKIIAEYNLRGEWVQSIEIKFNEKLVQLCEEKYITAVGYIKAMNDQLLLAPFGKDEWVRWLLS